MKHIFLLLAFIGLTFASCKKDIHCNCKVTTEQNNPRNPNDSVNGVVNTSYMYITVKNSTIRQAEKHQCADVGYKTEPTRYNNDGSITY